MEGRPETLAHISPKRVSLRRRLDGPPIRGEIGFRRGNHATEDGLRLIADLPDTGERKQQDLELQIALAGALTVVKGYAHPEAAEASGRARSLISERGERARSLIFRYFVGSGQPISWAASQRRRLTTLTSSCRSPNLSQILGW